jgi:hypothetical protein
MRKIWEWVSGPLPPAPVPALPPPQVGVAICQRQQTGEAMPAHATADQGMRY